MAWGTGVHKNARLDEVRVGRFRVFNCRQRPTLPHSFPYSTIGGIRLNFRVRNGNGCDPDPMTTGKLSCLGSRLRWPRAPADRRCSRLSTVAPKARRWVVPDNLKERLTPEYSANGSFARLTARRVS